MYYNDYDSSDEDARGRYRKAMAAFGGIAPSYHIERLDKPTIYWDFHSLLLDVYKRQMLYRQYARKSYRAKSIGNPLHISIIH